MVLSEVGRFDANAAARSCAGGGGTGTWRRKTPPAASLALYDACRCFYDLIVAFFVLLFYIVVFKEHGAGWNVTVALLHLFAFCLMLYVSGLHVGCLMCVLLMCLFVALLAAFFCFCFFG